MSERGYLDDERTDAGMAESGAYVMARRQFAISLTVAFALLALAALMAIGDRHETAAGMAPRRPVVGTAASRAQVAQAATKTLIAA